MYCSPSFSSKNKKNLYLLQSDHSVEKGVVVFLVIVIDVLIIQADVTIKIVLNACLLLPLFLKL